MKSQRIIIIGATSSIAEHCARLWAKETPSEIMLVGRNLEKMGWIRDDLKVRSPLTEVSCIEADFLNPQKIQQLARELKANKEISIVLIAHGWLSDQEAGQNNLAVNKDSLEINGISPVLFAEAFANEMGKQRHGTLAIIGSVAGDRGRKSNYIYGAAKGLVERYVQGLQHRFANTGLKVVLIKPGPTDTPMTAHLKKDGAKLASVEVVAEDIVSGIQKGKSVIYTPTKWQLIMLVIRSLPKFVFNKLDI